MKVAVNLSFPSSGLHWNDAGVVADTAYRKFASLPGAHPYPQGEGYLGVDYEFAVTDLALIDAAKKVYDSLLPTANRPCYEQLVMTSQHKKDPKQYSSFGYSYDELKSCNHLGFAWLGRLVGETELETSVADEPGGATVCCHGCGNPRENVGRRVRLKRKLVGKQHLLSLPSTRLICGDVFRHSCLDAGLTGLTFEPLAAGATRSAWYWVEVVQHKWQDESGVCPHCGMKTNVRSPAYFNLPEQYQHDFQRVLLFDEFNLVLSSRAVEFMSSLGLTSLKNVYVPILPGFHADIIAPEDRVFRNGDYPTRVLRR